MGVLSVRLFKTLNLLENKQQNRYLSYLAADEFRQSSQDLTRLARTYVSTGESMYENQYNDVIAVRNGKKARPDGSILSLTQIMKDLGFTAEEFELLNEAQAKSNALVATEVKAMNAVKGLFDDGSGHYIKGAGPDMSLARNLMFNQTYHQYIKEIMNPVNQFFSRLDNRTQAACDQLMISANLYMRISIALIVLLFMCLLLVSGVVYQQVIRSVGLLAEDVTVIGTGHLSKDIHVNQGGEVGQLTEALRAMTKNLADMVGTMISGVQTLNTSSGQLSAISEGMKKNAEETMDRSITVATASKEMSANMDTIAETSEANATNMQVITSGAVQLTLTVQEIAAKSEEARNLVNDAVSSADCASRKVVDLGHAADEINNVTEAITAISEQTNLLALNAAIEASRAGASGKGFAVVANEIKELASQTAIATQEIKKKISGIQEATNETINEIATVTADISNVNDIVNTIAAAVEEQSVTTKEISINVQQATQGMSEMNDNIAQSARVSASIAEDISRVSQASTTIAHECALVNKSSSELDSLAEVLSRKTSGFC